MKELERNKLLKLNPFTVIEYIKTSIDILVDLKVNEKAQEIESDFNQNRNNNSNVHEYEKLLWKSEADIRNFIRVIITLYLNIDRASNETSFG